jgi:hypothetical protein
MGTVQDDLQRVFRGWRHLRRGKGLVLREAMTRPMLASWQQRRGTAIQMPEIPSSVTLMQIRVQNSARDGK